MGLWDRRSAETDIERIFRESGEKTERNLRPLRDVVSAVVQAAVNSRDRTVKWINARNEKNAKTMEIFLFYEFLYLYLHLSMRTGFALFDESELRAFQDYLVKVVAPTAIDAYCAHWPEHYRTGMMGEFIDKMNDAETDYTQIVANSLANDDKSRFIEVFLYLGSNAAELCGRKGDLECQHDIALVSMEEWGKTELLHILTGIDKEALFSTLMS